MQFVGLKSLESVMVCTFFFSASKAWYRRTYTRILVVATCAFFSKILKHETWNKPQKTSQNEFGVHKFGCCFFFDLIMLCTLNVCWITGIAPSLLRSLNWKDKIKQVQLPPFYTHNHKWILPLSVCLYFQCSTLEFQIGQSHNLRPLWGWPPPMPRPPQKSSPPIVELPVAHSHLLEELKKFSVPETVGVQLDPWIKIQVFSGKKEEHGQPPAHPKYTAGTAH